jgi:hypothetical protein
MGKCMKKGCDKATEEDSNYCSAHQPGKIQSKTTLKLDRESAARPTMGGRPGPRPPPKQGS